MSVTCESGAQRWRPNVQLQVSYDFLNNSVFNLRIKVKLVSADRALMSSEFQTANAAAENAREEKTVLNVVAAEVELKPNVILLSYFEDNMTSNRKARFVHFIFILY